MSLHALQPLLEILEELNLARYQYFALQELLDLPLALGLAEQTFLVLEVLDGVDLCFCLPVGLSQRFSEHASLRKMGLFQPVVCYGEIVVRLFIQTTDLDALDLCGLDLAEVGEAFEVPLVLLAAQRLCLLEDQWLVLIELRL